MVVLTNKNDFNLVEDNIFVLYKLSLRFRLFSNKILILFTSYKYN